MNRVVVIGAGVGGLTTAAVLAQAGFSVDVLEAHIYPGGCAGTFYHKGYRFDAGATLAGGFYPGGPMDIVAQAVGIEQWPIRPAHPAMVVHLPDGSHFTRRTDDSRWEEREAIFGASSRTFWQWQESTADAMWDFALQLPPWPPQTPSEIFMLMKKGVRWFGNDPRRLQLLRDAFRPVAAHLDQASERLRLFVDAQLLISAQTTSPYANALYGASALDLPRRGVAHLEGGMGRIAEKLVQAIRDQGGEVHYRQQASRIVIENGRPVAVIAKTRRGQRSTSFTADIVVVNLPPWNIKPLLGPEAPPQLRNLSARPDGWGAFMVYAGLDESIIPTHFPLHHQQIIQEPLAEGNTVFLSLSPSWDKNRAPEGMRAMTLSTHTNLHEWWELFETDPSAYALRKTIYAQKLLKAAEKILPGLQEAIQLVLPGTPITFQRFTRRIGGWVGGFPQTSLKQKWGPRLRPHIWLVGDSIFPGQSTAAVALGGLRVAQAILR